MVKWNVLPRLRLALDRDLPTHHLGEAGRDREPEARAPEATGGRAVGLGEGVEDEALLVGGMPMPVSETREVEHLRPCPSTSAATATTTSPCSVNLIAFPVRLVTI